MRRMDRTSDPCAAWAPAPDTDWSGPSPLRRKAPARSAGGTGPVRRPVGPSGRILCEPDPSGDRSAPDGSGRGRGPNPTAESTRPTGPTVRPPMRVMFAMFAMFATSDAPGSRGKHGRRRPVRGGRASPWRSRASITGGLVPPPGGRCQPDPPPIRCIDCAKNTPVFRAKDGRQPPRARWADHGSHGAHEQHTGVSCTAWAPAVELGRLRFSIATFRDHRW
jgi:hypothetical protein